MRITKVHLKNYKRFTDLQIAEIPQSARLVVLVGPNGSGKSSVFDAFLLKSQSSRFNRALRDDLFAGYLLKDEMALANLSNTQQIANTIEIELDNPVEDWSTLFNIRSPYRHEADFSNTNLGSVRPAYESPRFSRIIDQDRAVSDNFNRLGRKSLQGALKSEPGDKSLNQFRYETLGEIQQALETLFRDPGLTLQDFGSGIDSGTFRFKKGTIDDFHYKNLSGGEKAAFDLLLDIFVKKGEYQGAIYCIDEPESHVASAIHGRLLEAMLKLIPADSQLWIATHSIGFLRKATEISRINDNVAFLDFSGRDFDESVYMTPTRPTQSFFRRMYEVLQEDLAGLVAPSCLVLCEGLENTDAKIYNKIFEDSHPDTLFVGRGSSSVVEKGDIIPVLEAVVPSTKIIRLIDRDDMPTPSREEYLRLGIRVLRRREIENYLWDKKVVGRALQNIGAHEETIEDILKGYPFQNTREDDMKTDNPLQILFEEIRHAEGVSLPGRNRREFAFAHLSQAVRETEEVFQELCEDIFSTDT